MADFDPREFRGALGAFATGVTVVTSRGADGTPVGLTANSFNSVSLDPPLVLWSLARNARSLPVFESAGYWTVHVLAADQEPLSNRFASRGEDKFAGLDVDSGEGGVPLLRGCAARFQCRTAFQYEGGDHIIFVGEVVAFDRSAAAPLVFHGGKYAIAAQKQPGSTAPRAPALQGSFSEDFLGYLLGRAHYQFYRCMREPLAAAGVSSDEHFVLATLTVSDGLSRADLQSAIAYTLQDGFDAVLDALLKRGLIDVHGEGDSRTYRLTPEGRECALRLIAAAKAFEAQIVERYGEGDAAALRLLLRRLNGLTDPGGGDFWAAGSAPT